MNDERKWIDIARRIRDSLAGDVDLMPAMSIEEQSEFIDSVQAAYWLHQNAMLFDKKVDTEKAKAYYDHEG